MIVRTIRRFASSTSGATIIEFAIVIPVLLMLVMGLGELAFQSYLQSVLTGSMQKAARDSTIDGNGTDAAALAIDLSVKNAVGGIIGGAKWDTSKRVNYAHFADIGPEYFFDSNSNNTYDKGECFIDTNANGIWDASPGASGQGGANGVVVYQMGFTYSRLFPLAGLAGWSSDAHLQSSTILKNQPYNFANTSDAVKVCK